MSLKYLMLLFSPLFMVSSSYGEESLLSVDLCQDDLAIYPCFASQETADKICMDKGFTNGRITKTEKSPSGTMLLSWGGSYDGQPCWMLETEPLVMITQVACWTQDSGDNTLLYTP